MSQKEVVYHRGGGTASYKIKMKSLYNRTTKCPNRHKNLDY